MHTNIYLFRYSNTALFISVLRPFLSLLLRSVSQHKLLEKHVGLTSVLQLLFCAMSYISIAHFVATYNFYDHSLYDRLLFTLYPDSRSWCRDFLMDASTIVLRDCYGSLFPARTSTVYLQIQDILMLLLSSLLRPKLPSQNVLLL